MNNKFLNEKIQKREKRVQRKYELEDEVYEFLLEASKTYNASISDILNLCISELLKTNNFKVYTNNLDLTYPARTLYISEKSLTELTKLKKSTNMTIKGLLNTAVRNIM